MSAMWSNQCPARWYIASAMMQRFRLSHKSRLYSALDSIAELQFDLVYNARTFSNTRSSLRGGTVHALQSSLPFKYSNV